MNLRSVDLLIDYPLLEKWWAGHKLPSVPRVILPSFGVFVVSGGVDIAAGWMYREHDGKLAVVDWITSNPELSGSPTVTEAIRILLGFFEKSAKDMGCFNLMSFVAKDTGLHRLLVREQWTDPRSTPHVYLFKALWP